MTCIKCNIKQYKNCSECNRLLCKQCDKDNYVLKWGNYICLNCKDNTLYLKCNGYLHMCMKCKRVHCIDCDDGACVSTSWDDLDVYYCHNCREIRLEELYSFFKNKYNEKDSLKEIRKQILMI